MNSVIENIITRRSTRSFLDKEIPQDTLDQILLAAIHAPTAMNKQAFMFTVIESREQIQKLAELIGKALDRPDYDMYKPQVLIIPSTPKSIEYGIDDNACALENIFLAAHSLGIGSCWINQMRQAIEDPEVRKELTKLGIPEENTVYGMAALGYPAETEQKEIKRTAKVVYIK